MFSAAWKMLKETVFAFINDEALSRGAAIAFYTVTSIAPVLLIVIAVAGLAFGREAADDRFPLPPLRSAGSPLTHRQSRHRFLRNRMQGAALRLRGHSQSTSSRGRAHGVVSHVLSAYP
jgi:hypothetical protein